LGFVGVVLLLATLFTIAKKIEPKKISNKTIPEQYKCNQYDKNKIFACFFPNSLSE
jgi:hypothetical protein